MIFLDTETCGYHGPAVLIQWARDNGSVHLHDVWTNPITDTLLLIEEFCNEPDGIVGFNLAFDWFHLQRLYNLLSAFPDLSANPSDVSQELAESEKDARDGLCIKPCNAFDLMLHARKGPYQSTMDRNDIRIKRVPTPLAWKLSRHLTDNLKFKDIYFERKQDKTERWKVFDITNDLGDTNPNFKDIVLKFAPSSALKALAVDALHLETTYYSEIEHGFKVKEKGWAPCYPETDWLPIIGSIVGYWAYNPLARTYAENDVIYTRALYKYFCYLDNNEEEDKAREYANSNHWNSSMHRLMGDDDSILACMVGSVRWKGFKIDVPKLKALRVTCVEQLGEEVSLATAPHIAKRYLESFMDATEKLAIQSSTKKQILEEITDWEADEGGQHPAAKAARRILDARKAKKRIEVIDKLLEAGRFHASFKVIGTLSSRMSGTDGLNAQGMDNSKAFRSCFPLAWDNQNLIGGDFASFEVTIAAAEYNDPVLIEEIKSGKKVHGLLGELFFKDIDYDQILASKGTEDDKYVKSKQGVFAFIYGGNDHTLHTRVGIDKESANDAFKKIFKKYKGIADSRQKVNDLFCSMRQPNGLGTKVEWHEPADYIESMLGFRRYFNLENRICKTLFDLAENMPKEWKEINIKVVRRDRQQTAHGAVRSALYAAAFSIQAAAMRAAANHRIQSTGAEITKHLERKIWDLQPKGIHAWEIMLLNIHDEIMSPCTPDLVNQVNRIVKDTIEGYRSLIPLIGMDWSNNIKTWADK